MNRHQVNPYWPFVANLCEVDIKEAMLTGFKETNKFPEYSFPLFRPGGTTGSILDFGCGIGRNFSILQSKCKKLYAFDIPEMVQACRKFGECDGVELSFDWGEISKKKYDVVIATLVIQHMSTSAFEYYVKCLAGICEYFYVTTRCWIDDSHDTNVFNSIEQLGCFRFVKGNVSKEEASSKSYPDDCHFDLIYQSRKTKISEKNRRLFSLERQTYPVSSTGISIAVAQLFTANFDDWAYKVAARMREYCIAHGYRYYYRRGVYNHALHRHASWHRIPLLLEIMQNDKVDWVFWSDIDSIVLRHDVRLETFLETHRDCDAVIPNQGSGIVLGREEPNVLCCGNFLIRNTEWSKTFLNTVWEYGKIHEYKQYLQESSWEQEIVNYIYLNDILDFSKHVEIVPNRCFNSFYKTQYREEDFIIHFAGETTSNQQDMEELIKEFSFKSKRSNQKQIKMGRRQIVIFLAGQKGAGKSFAVEAIQRINKIKSIQLDEIVLQLASTLYNDRELSDPYQYAFWRRQLKDREIFAQAVEVLVEILEQNYGLDPNDKFDFIVDGNHFYVSAIESIMSSALDRIYNDYILVKLAIKEDPVYVRQNIIHRNKLSNNQVDQKLVEKHAKEHVEKLRKRYYKVSKQAEVISYIKSLLGTTNIESNTDYVGMQRVYPITNYIEQPITIRKCIFLAGMSGAGKSFTIQKDPKKQYSAIELADVIRYTGIDLGIYDPALVRPPTTDLLDFLLKNMSSEVLGDSFGKQIPILVEGIPLNSNLVITGNRFRNNKLTDLLMSSVKKLSAEVEISKLYLQVDTPVLIQQRIERLRRRKKRLESISLREDDSSIHDIVEEACHHERHFYDQQYLFTNQQDLLDKVRHIFRS